MRRLSRAVLVLALALGSAACSKKAPAAPPPPAAQSADTAERELRAEVDHAIDMLESQQLVGFLKRYVAPAEVASYLANSSYEARAAQFTGRPTQKMLRKLFATRTVKPTWNADKSAASFPMDDELEGEFKFVRVDGKWYIQN